MTWLKPNAHLPRLDARLSSIREAVGACETFYDLCCDHGNLGLHLLASGETASPIFVDRSSELIAALRARAAEFLLPDAFSRACFLAAPAESIVPDAAGPRTIAIAGVGAKTIATILSAWHPHLREGDRVFFCPETRSSALDTLLVRIARTPRLLSEVAVANGRRTIQLVVF